MADRKIRSLRIQHVVIIMSRPRKMYLLPEENEVVESDQFGQPKRTTDENSQTSPKDQDLLPEEPRTRTVEAPHPNPYRILPGVCKEQEEREHVTAKAQ